MLIIPQGILCTPHKPNAGKEKHGAKYAAGKDYFQIIGIPGMVYKRKTTDYQCSNAQKS